MLREPRHRSTMAMIKEIVEEYTDYFKATFARCMFLMHAVIVMWRTAVLLAPTYWLLAIGVVAMLVEYLVTLIVRNGQEWRWVSPATLCYLLTAVPGLWLQRLYHLGHLDTVALTSLATVPSTSMTLDFSSEDWMLLSEQTMMVTIILSRWLLPKGNMTHDQVSQLLLLYLSLSSDIIDFLSLFGFDQVREDKTYCYVLLFWWTWSLLQFTLVLTSTENDDDNNNNGSDNNKTNNDDEIYVNEVSKTAAASAATDFEQHSGHHDLGPGPGPSPSPGPSPGPTDSAVHRARAVNAAVGSALGDNGAAEDVLDDNSAAVHVLDEKSAAVHVLDDTSAAVKAPDDPPPKALKLRKVLCSSELWAILAVLLLQDGPFLVNRLVVMAHLQVFNYTIIFFVCKNILVIVLQIYRMIVLISDSKAMVRQSKLQANTAAKARRYSTISVRSVSQLDDSDDDDEDSESGAGRSMQWPTSASRATPEGGPAPADDARSEQTASRPSAYHPPAFSAAYVAMPTLTRKKLSSIKEKDKFSPLHSPAAKQKHVGWGGDNTVRQSGEEVPSFRLSRLDSRGNEARTPLSPFAMDLTDAPSVFSIGHAEAGFADKMA